MPYGQHSRISSSAPYAKREVVLTMYRLSRLSGRDIERSSSVIDIEWDSVLIDSEQQLLCAQNNTIYMEILIIW